MVGVWEGYCKPANLLSGWLPEVGCISVGGFAGREVECVTD